MFYNGHDLIPYYIGMFCSGHESIASLHYRYFQMMAWNILGFNWIMLGTFHRNSDGHLWCPILRSYRCAHPLRLLQMMSHFLKNQYMLLSSGLGFQFVGFLLVFVGLYFVFAWIRQIGP